jgi:putative ABC transport system substrate-binding protein
MNNRRKLLVVLGSGALSAPFTSFAQQPARIGRIGYLSPYPSANDQRFEAFKQQLRDLGHVEGKTITIDYRSSEAKNERLPALAAELVRRNVDVIMADGGTTPANAARNAARTIPVVFAGVADPVGLGLVTSLARPGGNVTGISNQQRQTAVKTLEFLKEIVPSAKLVAVLSNPANSSAPLVLADMQAAARKLRLEIIVVNVGAPAEFDKAFTEIAQERPAGLVILADPLFSTEAVRLTALAAKHQLPTIGRNNAIPEGGGLMSYGANLLDLVRRAAFLVDKILKGANPADLPVEQPVKFELIVNMKTAKALGIKISNSILVSANKVIN